MPREEEDLAEEEDEFLAEVKLSTPMMKAVARKL